MLSTAVGIVGCHNTGCMVTHKVAKTVDFSLFVTLLVLGLLMHTAFNPNPHLLNPSVAWSFVGIGGLGIIVMMFKTQDVIAGSG